MIQVNDKIPDSYFTEMEEQWIGGSKNPVEISLPKGYSGVWVIKKEDEFNDNKCNHNWKNYYGFTSSFKYCVNCDEKRDINE